MLATTEALERLKSEAEKVIIIDPASSTPGSDYLEAIVRDPRQEKHFRARCARDLLTYERPRLQATALMTPDDFASRLDAAIRRSETAKLIDATPARPALPPAGPAPIPAGAPMARLRRV
jgi:hypothetical protein